ncbi:MAG TPA: hypothetical protein VEC16_02120 [Alphaproteobacteria bacterium]|nr:hypothetical protein [Alphaproteobacteria bacterium]
MTSVARKYDENNNGLKVVPLTPSERAEKIANIYFEMLNQSKAFRSLSLEKPGKKTTDYNYLIVEKGKGWGIFSNEIIIADLKFDGSELDVLSILIPFTQPKNNSKDDIIKDYEAKIHAILSANRDLFPKMRESKNFDKVKQGLLTYKPPLYLTLTQWKIDKLTELIKKYLEAKYGKLNVANHSNLISSSRTNIILEDQAKTQIATIEFITPNGQISFEDNVAIAINIIQKDERKISIVKEGKLKALAAESSKELFRFNKHVSVSLN